MTVNTPFANRPALPWLVNFRPTPLTGLGDDASTARAISSITSDVGQVFRILHEDEPGMYTVQMADGSITTYRQPVGSQATLPVGYGGGFYGGPGVSAGVQGSSTGLLIAAAIVAALFLFGGRK
jgi:hypothetical protein